MREIYCKVNEAPKESESALHCRLLRERDEAKRTEGRREVVEWIKVNKISIWWHEDEWDEKLKEWGVK